MAGDLLPVACCLLPVQLRLGEPSLGNRQPATGNSFRQPVTSNRQLVPATHNARMRKLALLVLFAAACATTPSTSSRLETTPRHDEWVTLGDRLQAYVVYPQTSQKAGAVLVKSIAADPADRFPSATAFKEALERLEKQDY